MKNVHKQSAFTLIELLISLSFSSFIILGLMQNYQNVVKYIDRSREMMNINRKVSLFFNQFERDVMAAFIPMLHKEIAPEKEEKFLEKKKREEAEKEKGDQSKRDKEKAQEKKQEKMKEFFLGSIDDSTTETLRGKQHKQFKSLTFISTNALQVYAQKRERFVRVLYTLEKDKQASKKDKITYKLIRKETGDIENVKMKERDAGEKGVEYPVRTHLIADNIKGLHLEYVTDKKIDKKNNSNRNEEQEESLQMWGEKDFTKGVVPKYINVIITCWDSDLKKEYTFEALFPILSYPTEKSDKDDSEKNKDKEQEEKEPGTEKTEEENKKPEES